MDDQKPPHPETPWIVSPFHYPGAAPPLVFCPVCSLLAADKGYGVGAFVCVGHSIKLCGHVGLVIAGVQLTCELQEGHEGPHRREPASWG